MSIQTKHASIAHRRLEDRVTSEVWVLESRTKHDPKEKAKKEERQGAGKPPPGWTLWGWQRVTPDVWKLLSLGLGFSGAAAGESLTHTRAYRHAHTPQLIRQSVRKERQRTLNSCSYTIQGRLMDAERKAGEIQLENQALPACPTSRQKPTACSDLRGSLLQPRGAEKEKTRMNLLGNIQPPCGGEKQTTVLVHTTLACNPVNCTAFLERACHDQITQSNLKWTR